MGAALGRLRDRGLLEQVGLAALVRQLVLAPLVVHPDPELLVGAAARSGLRLGDALLVELSDRLSAPLLTTDHGLASAWPRSWLVTAAAAAVPHPSI